MYKGVNETEGLRDGQTVLCRCPHWCDEGLMVGFWNGAGDRVGVERTTYVLNTMRNRDYIKVSILEEILL